MGKGTNTVKKFQAYSERGTRPVEYCVSCFICGNAITERDRSTTVVGRHKRIHICELCRPARGRVVLSNYDYGAQPRLNFTPGGKEHVSSHCPHCNKRMLSRAS